ncbi:MAG TPA: hypothetical protein ENF34_01135 [Candidatus Bathyarchaeota archaeon]|nr:MAG: hypothetical protein DRO60_00415 [Candidatus Bathyarchaeota archaeon]HDJ25908.1 hypothetical protein [Candidatus Bathyarchaeota archaeon]
MAHEVIRDLSRRLGVPEDELVRRGLRAYLEEELRKVRARINAICVKYGVRSLEELDEKINRGEVAESDAFEDFARLDHLEALRRRLEEALEILGQGHGERAK